MISRSMGLRDIETSLFRRCVSPCVAEFARASLRLFLRAPRIPRETCWFFPPDCQESVCIDFRFDPENVWYQRVADVNPPAVQRWEGMVQVARPISAGISTSFRLSSRRKTLFDLYDHPEDIKWLTWKAHERGGIFRSADSIVRVTIRDIPPGRPFFRRALYMLQCDFSYMIGPEMFDEFVKPNSPRHASGSIIRLPPRRSRTARASRRHPSIPELKGVQWIPGAGAPNVPQLADVFRKIRDAGNSSKFSAISAILTPCRAARSAEGIMLVAQETDASKTR